MKSLTSLGKAVNALGPAATLRGIAALLEALIDDEPDVDMQGAMQAYVHALRANATALPSAGDLPARGAYASDDAWIAAITSGKASAMDDLSDAFEEDGARVCVSKLCRMMRKEATEVARVLRVATEAFDEAFERMMDREGI